MGDARPTKKQLELLRFVDGFIKGNGYGPSYREIQKALGYKSVSTVAIHIDNLVAKGLLAKTGEYTARSVELVEDRSTTSGSSAQNSIKYLKNELAKLEQNDDYDKNLATAIRTVIEHLSDK